MWRAPTVLVSFLSECRLLSTEAIALHQGRSITTNQDFKTQPKFRSPLQTFNSWKSKEEFISYLKESIFFHHSGLIALNKPYGVAVYRPKTNEPKPMNRMSRSKIPETKYTLEDALPGLQEQLNLRHIQIMKCTERFTTGICILATTRNAANDFAASIRKSTSNHIPIQSYWAVTRFTPAPPVASDLVGLKLVSVEEDLEPEIIWKPSRTQSKLKRLKLVNVEHRCLSVNNHLGVALCQVDANSNKAHFVRVYLIQRSCCVLGDTLYSPRLRSVLGRTVLLSPHNYNKYVDPFPSMEAQAKTNLGLGYTDTGEEMAHLPVMLHLRSFTLKKWQKRRDLVLTAPLPEHFRWTCGQLKLDTIPKTTEDVQLIASG